MATHKGGYRPGAGRKPKVQKYAGAINAAERKIKDELPAVIDALLSLAKGIKTVSEDGVIYTQLPDRAAGIYLANRIMGSPVQRSEIDGSIGTIRIVYDDVELDEETDQDEESKGIQ